MPNTDLHLKSPEFPGFLGCNGELVESVIRVIPHLFNLRLVGDTGFEPATSRPPAVRATAAPIPELKRCGTISRPPAVRFSQTKLHPGNYEKNLGFSHRSSAKLTLKGKLAALFLF